MADNFQSPSHASSSRPSNASSGNTHDLTDIYPFPEPVIKYELTTLPLQQEVGQVRRFLCHYYSLTKEHWLRTRRSMNLSLDNTKKSLEKYGIRDTTLLFQSTAVGGAVLLGYIIGRRSPYKKYTYPLMGGALVGGAIYFSDKTRQQECLKAMDRYRQKLWPTQKK